MQFTTEHSPQIDLDVSYANKLISQAWYKICWNICRQYTVLENSCCTDYTQIKCSLQSV